MGAKAQLQRQIRRAGREGNSALVRDLSRQLNELTEARGNAAYLRGITSNKKYKVESGESWFSIAKKLYGDERYAFMLLQANPNINRLYTGLNIRGINPRGRAAQ